jgi:saccharopine dehydrogenase-like NADP-dependent oxidoreductase
MLYLGWENPTLINRGKMPAAIVLQQILEERWQLSPTDKDMVVMVHEIEYVLAGKKYLTTSQLVVKGEDALHTAMAKTVGLPLGIAARLQIEGKWQLKGLHIPVLPDIYTPVLAALEQEGIQFVESTKSI